MISLPNFSISGSIGNSLLLRIRVKIDNNNNNNNNNNNKSQQQQVDLEEFWRPVWENSSEKLTRRTGSIRSVETDRAAQ